MWVEEKRLEGEFTSPPTPLEPHVHINIINIQITNERSYLLKWKNDNKLNSTARNSSSAEGCGGGVGEGLCYEAVF